MMLEPFGVGWSGSITWPSLIRPGVWPITFTQTFDVWPLSLTTPSEAGTPPSSLPM